MFNNIEGWTVPKWHEDFGSPQVEFDALKKISKVCVTQISDLSVKLDCYEEGYMNIDLFINELNKIGEIHIVESDQYTYGLFLNDSDEDQYFHDTDKDILALVGEIKKQSSTKST